MTAFNKSRNGDFCCDSRIYDRLLHRVRSFAFGKGAFLRSGYARIAGYVHRAVRGRAGAQAPLSGPATRVKGRHEFLTNFGGARLRTSPSFPYHGVMSRRCPFAARPTACRSVGATNDINSKYVPRVPCRSCFSQDILLSKRSELCNNMYIQN